MVLQILKLDIHKKYKKKKKKKKKKKATMTTAKKRIFLGALTALLTYSPVQNYLCSATEVSFSFRNNEFVGNNITKNTSAKQIRTEYNLEKIISDDIQIDSTHGVTSLLLNKMANLLLICLGYKFDSGKRKWNKLSSEQNEDESLQKCVSRITPSWKKYGNLDYASLPVDLVQIEKDGSLQSIPQMLNWFREEIGLEKIEIDDSNKYLPCAIHEMFEWEMDYSENHAFNISDIHVLFIFSFDHSKNCQRNSCESLGDTNELLALTTLNFLKTNIFFFQEKKLKMFVQWEIARILEESDYLDSSEFPVFVSGNLGTFHNTPQIWDNMLQNLQNDLDTLLSPKATSINGLVLAHPDHLIRVMKTGFAALDKLFHRNNFQKETKISIFPALIPFHLNWTSHHLTNLVSSSQYDIEALNVQEMNIYQLTPQKIHLRTGREMSWFDKNLGYSPSNNEYWARNRENWILYEMWARAKGVNDGTLKCTNLSKK
mmetsp:Transcript_33047/g.43504  ORF Transcript_33047/g.43504 Transcript_33047/m.43504 type:complete len:486 (+) Transcript_33047:330-1787(+)